MNLVIKNKLFAKAYIAETVSLFGTFFRIVGWYGLLVSSADPGKVIGLLFIVQTIPGVILTPLGGKLADKYSSKKILMYLQFIMAGASLCFLPFISQPVNVGAILLLECLITALGCVQGPAFNVLLAECLDKKDLESGYSLQNLSYALVGGVAAVCGGFIASAMGVKGLIIVDAITFLVAGGLFIQIFRSTRSAHRESVPHLGHAENGKSFALLVKEYRKDSRFFFYSSLKGMLALGAGAVVIIPIMMNDYFSADISGKIVLGLYIGFKSLGSGLAPYVARIIRYKYKKIRIVHLMSVGLLINGICYLVISFYPSLVVTFLLIFIAHLGSNMIFVFSSVLIQRASPKYVLGRAFGYEGALFCLVTSVVCFIAGYVVDLGFNLSTLLAIASIIPIATSAIWLFNQYAERTGPPCCEVIE